eukprot:scaffold187367_cov18-Tisochrysis_lutea.AAC.1
MLAWIAFHTGVDALQSPKKRLPIPDYCGGSGVQCKGSQLALTPGLLFTVAKTQEPLAEAQCLF